MMLDFLKFSPDGASILGGSQEGGLIVLDCRKGTTHRVVGAPHGPIRDVAFLEEGRIRVLSGGLDVSEDRDEATGRLKVRPWAVQDIKLNVDR